MANDNEVYYCGKCWRQQKPSEGIKCKVCGKSTVSWRLSGSNSEESDDVHNKWQRLFGV